MGLAVMVLKDFLLDESGAVATDWAMLAASTVATAFTVVHDTGRGIGNLGNDLADELAGIEISTRFGEDLYSFQFTGGQRGGWQGGVLRDYGGFDEVLALGADAPEAQLEIDVPGEYEYAVLEFDMTFGDSWDTVIDGRHQAAEAVITVNGEEVVVGTFDYRDEGGPTVTTFTDGYGNSTTVELTSATQGTGAWHTGGSSVDYTYSVRVVTDNPTGNVVVGASTDLDQNTGDEFFAIDNMSVRGTNTIDPNA